MTVFMLGAGVMQIPALMIGRELGWRVVAADGNPRAPGAELCNRFFAIDLKDREGLLAAALGLREEGHGSAPGPRASRGIDAVFTAGTDFSATVAWLADRLGLPGHRPEAALAASDKLIMRSKFAAAGLSSPRFVECSAVEAGLSSPERQGLGFPLVVKPADNMGARGCRLVLDEAGLARALAAALPLSRTGRAIIEEYIEGPEFSIDALVYDGRVEIRGFADRHIAFSPYFVELGHTIPSGFDERTREAVLAVFEAGVRSLGLSHGAAKGDMKWSSERGRPVIGEIAARLSGGYMSGWTYPYASGIDLTRDALLLAAGLRPEGPRVDQGWYSAERAFISIPGRVAGIEGLRASRNAPFVKDLFLRTGPGEEVVFPSNNVEKCGNLISQAPDRERASNSAEEALRSIFIRLEAPNEATAAFLRGQGVERGFDGAIWPPRAFAVDAALDSAIEALPEGSLRPASNGEPISVAALPVAEGLTALDWSGRTLVDSARIALERGGGLLVPGFPAPADLPIVGRAFWKALIVGGAQGGLYILECLRKGAALP